jgi:hypothetical protein
VEIVPWAVTISSATNADPSSTPAVAISLTLIGLWTRTEVMISQITDQDCLSIYNSCPCPPYNLGAHVNTPKDRAEVLNPLWLHNLLMKFHSCL